MKKSILSSIGNTPLIYLSNISKEIEVNVYGKLEFMNPAGSMKDRVARYVIQHAIQTNKINRDTIVIESTSGNMGIGLAMVCAYYNIRLICVVDSKASKQNINIIKAYGGEIVRVTDNEVIDGNYLQSRINKVKYLCDKYKNSFCPSQYTNKNIPKEYYRTIIKEIYDELKEVDYLLCPVSTCGTIRGCYEYIKEKCLNTEICAVDAVGSVIFGGEKGARYLPGHGASIVPYFSHGLRENLYDCFYVTDQECIDGCKYLLRAESILAGASSGGTMQALINNLNKIDKNSNCVMIFPDRGERYLDTVYSEEWCETFKEHQLRKISS